MAVLINIYRQYYKRRLESCTLPALHPYLFYVSSASTYFMRLFRRKEIPWEVVDIRSVDPVYMYYDDNSEGKPRRYKTMTQVDPSPTDFQIIAIKDTNITRTYLLDVKNDTRQSTDLHNAVIFAREQLLQEAEKSGYNILWLERYYLPYLLEFSV